jgi:hypothetical protein
LQVVREGPLEDGGGNLITATTIIDLGGTPT